jgi:hypothetical protein
MKKIVIVILTFLGICTGFAQNPAATDMPQNMSTPSTIQKTGHDSVTIKEVASVKLYPNPAKNKVELELKNFEAGIVQLQIVSAAGKIMRNDTRLLFSGNESMVVMFALSPGIYFIVLKQKITSIKKKIVVQ